MHLRIEVNYLRRLHIELKWPLLINTYAVSFSELHLGNGEQQVQSMATPVTIEVDGLVLLTFVSPTCKRTAKFVR